MTAQNDNSPLTTEDLRRIEQMGFEAFAPVIADKANERPDARIPREIKMSMQPKEAE